MSKKDNLIIAKIKTLYNEHLAYSRYYDKFVEELDEKKKELATKVDDKDFEKILEEFSLEFYVLKFNYRMDLDILLDKMFTYVNAAKLIELDKYIPEQVIDLLKKHSGKAIQPRFFMYQDKPTEVEEGYVEALRENLKEQGNLPKLIQNLKK